MMMMMIRLIIIIIAIVIIIILILSMIINKRGIMWNLRNLRQMLNLKILKTYIEQFEKKANIK